MLDNPFGEYTIWQQDTGGSDLVRFTQDDSFVVPAGGLAADRSGRALYDARGNSDVMLVIDERPWVILTKIR